MSSGFKCHIYLFYLTLSRESLGVNKSNPISQHLKPDLLNLYFPFFVFSDLIDGNLILPIAKAKNL